RRHRRARHRCHDRRAHEKLFRQDGARPRDQARDRFPQGLYAAVREQEGRERSAAEMKAAHLALPGRSDLWAYVNLSSRTARRADPGPNAPSMQRAESWVPALAALGRDDTLRARMR